MEKQTERTEKAVMNIYFPISFLGAFVTIGHGSLQFPSPAERRQDLFMFCTLGNLTGHPMTITWTFSNETVKKRTMWTVKRNSEDMKGWSREPGFESNNTYIRSPPFNGAGQHELILFDVRERHEGIYSCEITTDDNTTATYSKTLQVTGKCTQLCSSNCYITLSLYCLNCYQIASSYRCGMVLLLHDILLTT